MAITALDHLYVETHDWDGSVAFWEGLGLSFAERWGDDGHRAGRLVSGDAVVVLAEVETTRPAAFNAFFTLADADRFAPADAVAVETPLSDTHWGTRWVRVRDPEGRVFCLEESGEG